MFDKTIIIGAGLVGGSIGMGLKLHKISKNIIFIDLSCDQIALAQSAEFSVGNYNSVVDADCVILATPVLSMPAILQEIRSFLTPAVLIMDVASTKTFLIREAQKILGDLFPRFVPTHPIAGKERSGFAAADAALFQGRPVVLTPTMQTSREALTKGCQIWKGLGAHVYEMTAEAHDLVFAKYSHLPNILSFLLMNQSRQEPRLPPGLLPPSFIEMTRLAGSDPLMWSDICLSNRDAILQILETFEKDLLHFKQMLVKEKKGGIYDFFYSANNLKKDKN